MYLPNKNTKTMKADASGPLPRFLFVHGLAFIYVAAVSALMFLSGASGCGKKAMPSPPDAGEIPAVTDLSHDIQGGVLFLKWTVPERVGAGTFGEGDMVISRARTRLTDELCEGCPLIYQRIAVLPIPETKVNATQTHFEKIVKGFRYTYRVELHMSGGRKSAVSNLVRFDY